MTRRHGLQQDVGRREQQACEAETILLATREFLCLECPHLTFKTESLQNRFGPRGILEATFMLEFMLQIAVALENLFQIIASVGSAAKGSKNAVSGCGTTIMSLSLIACQPRMLEPSKPRPSSNTSSVSLFTGTVKCCQTPGKSMNRKSTARTFFSRQNAKTSFGFTSVLPPEFA